MHMCVYIYTHTYIYRERNIKELVHTSVGISKFRICRQVSSLESWMTVDVSVLSPNPIAQQARNSDLNFYIAVLRQNYFSEKPQANVLLRPAN